MRIVFETYVELHIQHLLKCAASIMRESILDKRETQAKTSREIIKLRLITPVLFCVCVSLPLSEYRVVKTTY